VKEKIEFKTKQAWKSKANASPWGIYPLESCQLSVRVLERGTNITQYCMQTRDVQRRAGELGSLPRRQLSEIILRNRSMAKKTSNAFFVLSKTLYPFLQCSIDTYRFPCEGSVSTFKVKRFRGDKQFATFVFFKASPSIYNFWPRPQSRYQGWVA
jgi:hypothetical protein